MTMLLIFLIWAVLTAFVLRWNYVIHRYDREVAIAEIEQQFLYEKEQDKRLQAEVEVGLATKKKHKKELEIEFRRAKSSLEVIDGNKKK